MEKRLILAFALTILVFIGFQQFQQRTLDKTGKIQAPEQIQTQNQTTQKPVEAIPAEKAAQPANASPEDTNAGAQTLVVKGDLYQAVIDNRGALLTGWMLNQYKSTQNRIFEMIAASHGGENRSFPTSLLFDDQGLSNLANNEFYLISVNGQPYDGKELAPPVTAIFKLKKGRSLDREKFQLRKRQLCCQPVCGFTDGRQTDRW